MALIRFPEEVWEKILERVDDSRDILAVFKAYPELDGRILKNRYAWLIDQVIPHIRPWLENGELLQCRQVCRRWSRAVCNHLENHPIRKVVDPDPDRLITGQVWFPEASQAHQQYELWNDFGTVNFTCQNADLLTEFLQEMGTLHTRINPFPGRSIQLDDQPHQYDFIGVMTKEDVLHFWNESLELLRQFGGHIWYLSIQHYHNVPENPLHFCQFVLDALSLLPNLRGLKLGKSFPDNDPVLIKEFLQEREDSMPYLPQLETLHFTSPGSPQDLVNILVMTYAPQIRRLSIDEHNWKLRYSNVFPNLLELTLNSNWKVEVDTILESLNAPKLSSLYLMLERETHPVGVEDVVRWLRPFPQINSFHLEAIKFVESNEVMGLFLHMEHSTVPCLKSLTIQYGFDEQEELKWEFLGSFPALEYLKIIRNLRADSWTRKNDLFNEGVWEIMGNLKGIVLDEKNYETGRIRRLHFSRTRYEFVKGQNNVP